MQSKSILLLSAIVGVAFAQDPQVPPECKAFDKMQDACPAMTKIVQLAAANPTQPEDPPASLITEQASCECYDDKGKWIPEENSSLRKKCYEWVKSNNPGGVHTGDTSAYVNFCSSVGDVNKKDSDSKTTPVSNAASATETGAAATGADASGTDVQAIGSETTGGAGAEATGTDDASGTDGMASASGTGSKNSTGDATLSFKCGAALGLVVLPVLLSL